MKRRMAFALCGAAVLSGCYSYPRLSSPPPPTILTAGSPTDLESILVEASTLQGEYSTGYRQGARFSDFSQLPLIGAAAGAAWILLNNRTDAANVAGKIAIGAGAYSTARGQLVAAALPDVYIAGHGALTCVLAEGSIFAGRAALQNRNGLDAKLLALANAIEALDVELVVTPGGTPTNDELAMLAAARTLARQTITQARAAEQTSLVQAGAFDDAARVFRNAVAAISVRVASRGRVRPAVDFATLRDSFAAAPKTPTTPAGALGIGLVGPAPAPPSVGAVVTAITAATTDLVTATAILSASTPHYTDSLTRVTACPNQIT